MLMPLVGPHHIQNDVLEQRMMNPLYMSQRSLAAEVTSLRIEVERLRVELEARDEADFYTYRYKAAIANESLMFLVRDELLAKINAMRPVVDAARAWAEEAQMYVDNGVDTPLERAIIDAMRALDNQCYYCQQQEGHLPECPCYAQ